MKRLLFLLLTLISLQADESANDDGANDCDGARVEVKLGYFRFCNPTLRKTYRTDTLDTQLVASGPFCSNPSCQWLRLYGGVGYITKDGRTRSKHHRTNLTLIPASVGLQGVVRVAHDVRYYLTLGPRFFYIQETHHSAKNRCGGFANTGFLLIFRENIFIDFFAEYSVSMSPQVGGLTLGGGVGYQF